MAERGARGDLRGWPRVGRKFPEEKRTHGAQSPGVVQDGEELERRLPLGTRETGASPVPVAPFTRRDLQWSEAQGGASVDRCRYAQVEAPGPREPRGTIKAKSGDIRRLTDALGIRLWSITDRPVPGNRAHAEIQREPRGRKPGREERAQFMEVWRGAAALLRTQKGEDPLGKPELRLVRDTGLEIHWRSGHDGQLRRVVQVESVAEAVRAYIGAGLLSEADAAQEQRILQQHLVERSRSRPDRRWELI